MLPLLPIMLKGAYVTLEVSLIGIAGGIVGGLLFGLFSSHKFKLPLISSFIKVYVILVRGTPLFLQLLIIYFVLPEIIHLPISPLMAGIIALSANSTAYIAEIIRGGINTISQGQWDSSFCLGYSKLQTAIYIILPQTIKNVLPALINEFVTLIKESSILMILGVMELTKVSKELVAKELKPFEIYLMAALIYLLMTSSLSLLTKKFERRSYDHHYS